jgi:hypothetical protein
MIIKKERGDNKKIKTFYLINILPEHVVLEGQAWAKLPIHRKSSIRASKVRRLLPSMICNEKLF